PSFFAALRRLPVATPAVVCALGLPVAVPVRTAIALQMPRSPPKALPSQFLPFSPAKRVQLGSRVLAKPSRTAPHAPNRVLALRAPLVHRHPETARNKTA